MSIRVRLLISYALMVAIPLILLYASIHILFHIFVGEVADIKKHFNPENHTLEQFLQDEVVTFGKLQQDVLQQPDRLLKPGVLEKYDQELSDRRTGLLLTKEGEIIYLSPSIDSNTAGQIPEYRTENSLRFNYTERSLYINDKWMISLGFPVSFGDGTQGELYVVIDTNPISKFVKWVLPVLIIVFIIIFIGVNIVITYLMSRYLLGPIKKLKEAAEQMKEGNLEFSPGLKRKDELGELSEAFDEMRLRLKESIDTQLKYEDNRKQLLTNISHDLRTPLTSIKGYVNGIKDGVANNPEKLADYLDTISEKTSELDRLIDELFLYSKLDADRMPFLFTEIPLAAYMDDYVKSADVEMQQRGIELHYENSLPAHLKVTADSVQLKRVIGNILSNCSEHMRNTDKKITIQTVMDEREEGFAKIYIEDNGIGIEKSQLPHVFERFYRVDSSRNRQNGGSGLGLAIARQIIEAHGGSIGIESETGKGTSLYFTLRIVH